MTQMPITSQVSGENTEEREENDDSWSNDGAADWPSVCVPFAASGIVPSVCVPFAASGVVPSAAFGIVPSVCPGGCTPDGAVCLSGGTEKAVSASAAPDGISVLSEPSESGAAPNIDVMPSGSSGISPVIPPPPPLFEPVSDTSRSPVSISASGFSCCPSEVEGMLPSSCPRTLSTRSSMKASSVSTPVW